METDPNISPANVVYLRRSGATNEPVEGDDSPRATLPRGDSAPTLPDLDQALLDSTEEMGFNWPESPVERISVGITRVVLALLLLAGLVAFGYFRF